MADLAWAQAGGILSDGNGDIALVTGAAEVQSLIVSRVKASVEDWQMYTFSAGLETNIGQIINSTTLLQIQRQVATSLSDILTSNQYSVKTIQMIDSVQLYVFFLNSIIVTGTITADNVSVVGS